MATNGRIGILDVFWSRPYALLLFPPLFWAGNLLIGRAYAAELAPLGLTFWRWVIATACLLPFVWRELCEKRRMLLRSWPVILGCGASGFAGYPVLNYIALHTTPAATAAMLNSSLPLMVPLFAWIITRQAPSPRMLGGIVVSFIGVGWIIGRGSWTVLASFSVGFGEMLVLAAVACFALYCVLLRYGPKEVSPLSFLAAMMIATIAVTFPFWIAEMLTDRSLPMEPYAIASLLFIGVFPSLIANILWNHCVAALGASLTGASFHLMAVYSSVLAALLLGERIRGFHVVGISLILIGFALAILPVRSTHSALSRQ